MLSQPYIHLDRNSPLRRSSGCLVMALLLLVISVSASGAEAALSPADDVVILDGIPRSVRQCKMLDAEVDVLAVVHLATQNDEPIVERLLLRGSTDGRDDDRSEAIIRRRFDIYRQTTAPVLDYYPAEIRHEINPLGTPIEVKKRILERIIPVLRGRATVEY